MALFRYAQTIMVSNIIATNQEGKNLTLLLFGDSFVEGVGLPYEDTLLGKFLV